MCSRARTRASVGPHSTTGSPQNSGPAAGNTSRYKAFDLGPNAQRLLAFDDRFGSDGAYLSVDGGACRKQRLASGELDLPYASGIEMEVAEVAAANPDVMFAAGSANVVRSIDGGATWADAANELIAPGRYKGRGFSGLVSREATFNPWVRRHIVVQGFDGARVLQSLDGGASWTLEGNDVGPFGGGAGTVFASATRAYASLGFQSRDQGGARTSDGGLTWDVVSGNAAGLPEVDSVAEFGAIHASRANPDHVWLIIDGDVHESTDGGDSASSDDNRLFLTGEDQCYVSIDGAGFLGIGGPARPGKVAMGPDDTLWVAAHDRTGNPGQGLWSYTPEQGRVQELDPASFPGPFGQAVQYMVDVDVSTSNPDLIVFTTSDPPFRDVSRASGVYISEDRGVSWKRINRGLPMLCAGSVTFDPFDDRRLVLGTIGRGFFSYLRP